MPSSPEAIPSSTSWEKAASVRIRWRRGRRLRACSSPIRGSLRPGGEPPTAQNIRLHRRRPTRGGRD